MKLNNLLDRVRTSSGLGRVINRLAVISLTGALFSAAACSNSAVWLPQEAASLAKPVDQHVNVNLYGDFHQADSLHSDGTAVNTVLNAVHEGLYRMDEEGILRPALASALPDVSADGLVYTITLREDARWADGTPLTAQHFVYAYERLLDPAVKSRNAPRLAWIKGAAKLLAGAGEANDSSEHPLGVKALSDSVLEITLEHPVAFFPQELTHPAYFPLKPDFVAAAGGMYAKSAQHFMGAGPYKMTEWIPGERLVLQKNEQYWDRDKVKLEKITVYLTDDPGTALERYRQGEADLTALLGEQYKLFVKSPELKVKEEQVTAFLLLHQLAPPFHHPKIRQALGLAVDRKAFVDKVLDGISDPAEGLVPDKVNSGAGFFYRDAAGSAQAAYDPGKAKKLLAEGLQELELDKLPVIKLTADNNETASLSAAFIAAAWKEHLGVDTRTELLPFEARKAKMEKGQFEAMITLWGADYDDPMTFMDLWLSDNTVFNYARYSNAVYDQKVKEAEQVIDLSARTQLLMEAEKLLLQDAPIYPLYYRHKPYAVRPRLKQVSLPAAYFEWDLKESYVEVSR